MRGGIYGLVSFKQQREVIFFQLGAHGLKRGLLLGESWIPKNNIVIIVRCPKGILSNVRTCVKKSSQG